MSCWHRSAHFSFRGLIALIAAVVMMPAGRVVALAPTELRTVALVGQPAAGIPGASYSYIESGHAQVNDNGRVAFTALLAGSGITGVNNFGLWTSDAPGSEALIARTGNQPPGLPTGVTFSNGIYHPRLNNRGEVTFHTGIEPAEDPIESGVFTNSGGPLRVLAADRYPLPNTPGSPTVSRGAYFESANNSGQSSFYTPFSNSWSYWVDTPGQALRRVVSSGDTVPGFSSPKLSSFDYGWLADNGRIAFAAFATTNNGNYHGLWSETSGTMQLIAREGGTAPGTGLTIQSIYNPTMSSNGLLAFDAFMNGGSRRVFAQRPDGTLRSVAATGQPIPGTTSALTNLYQANINTLGRVAFVGFTSGFPQSSATSVWFEDSLGLQVAARFGQVAPGTGGAQFATFEDIQFNDNGDLMFEATLAVGTAGITTSNDAGIWLRQRDGQIKPIVREGDFLDAAPGPAIDLRQVSYPDSAGPYALIRQLRRMLTNNGEVLFSAYFTDGTTGLFLSQPIPEPAGIALAMITCAMLLATRRSTRGHASPIHGASR